MQRCAGSIQETETVQRLHRKGLRSRTINYSRGGLPEYHWVRGREEERGTGPLPRVGFRTQRRVCWQPKGRQKFTHPFAELVPWLRKQKPPREKAGLRLERLSRLSRLLAGEQVHAGSLAAESLLLSPGPEAWGVHVGVGQLQ